jgi:hypothetical protein
MIGQPIDAPATAALAWNIAMLPVLIDCGDLPP